MHIWLQESAAVDHSTESRRASSTERTSQLDSRRAFQKVAFNRLPPSGSSVDLFAATAVEVHLPPLPSLKLSPSTVGLKSSDVDHTNGQSSSQIPSAAIVPPFVIWRNASFATLKRLARSAALAARRADILGSQPDSDYADVAVNDAPDWQRKQRNFGADVTADIIEDSVVTVQGAQYNTVFNEKITSRSDAYGDLSPDVGAADESLILDQMLVHLARPLLCTKHAMRPARVLVLGDSHSLIFNDVASHYHDPGMESLEVDECAMSNYQACLSVGASAHGLGNPHSKVCTGKHPNGTSITHHFILPQNSYLSAFWCL